MKIDFDPDRMELVVDDTTYKLVEKEEGGSGEKPEYQTGDLVKHQTCGYGLVTNCEKADEGLYVKTNMTGFSGNDGYWIKNQVIKVGSFRPTEQALEDVPEKQNGQLVYSESWNGPAFWTGVTDGEYYMCLTEKGTNIRLQSPEETGIWINLHDCPEKE